MRTFLLPRQYCVKLSHSTQGAMPHGSLSGRVFLFITVFDYGLKPKEREKKKFGP